jgi:TetR/AcrR family transcriptional regulator, fatty acid biosynthesis regulator
MPKLALVKSAAKKSVITPVKDSPPRRQRLSPEVRSGLILDCAAKLILEDGFTEISMERIGRDAGVSKALIYNYFPNMTDLLRALLEREIAALRVRSLIEIKASGSFEDLVRRTTRMYICHIAERGPLLQRLWKESSVARSVAEVDRVSRDETRRYFVKRVRKEYGLPLDVAIAAVDMQMAMTETAAQHLSNTNNDVDLATDICVHLLLGGMEALAKAYQKS